MLGCDALRSDGRTDVVFIVELGDQAILSVSTPKGAGGREAGWLPRVNEEDRFYARATVTESGSAS